VTVDAVVEGTLSVSLPKVRVERNGVRVEAEGNRLRVSGPADRVARGVFDVIRRFVEENFRGSKGKDAKDRVAMAYASVSPALLPVIMECGVEESHGAVTIYVPPDREDYISRLIGRSGRTVREVQRRIGKSIVIAKPASQVRQRAEGDRVREVLEDLLGELV
jgi:hypothetical protein